MIKIFKNFAYFVLNLFSTFKYAGNGLTKVPKNKNSTVSDLFLWVKTEDRSTYFEFININYLINPIDPNLNINTAKFVFFDNNGLKFHETEIAYSKEGRNSINISSLLPTNYNGYGTFSCFHTNNTIFSKDSNTFIAERGYCGYSFQNNLHKSYVHGNLDAIANYKEDYEMLGNYNNKIYIYNLQYEFEPDINYEIFLTNPTKRPQKLRLFFSNNKSLDENIVINSKGSYKKLLFFNNKVKLKLAIESKMYMSRPIVFRYHYNSLDIFHG